MRTMKVAMTTRAIRLINCHASGQVGICRLSWILDFWSAAVNRSVERRHGDFTLKCTYLYVRTWVRKSKTYVAEDSR